ncbi:hypothetical protein DFH07DRAFT_951234 [Mycena maculata]|uniref:Uncharacterized protein n=1 Tax=Mycena maculata TaxID=230809 RepID=A0AAD7K3F2_9AGAR|nr:hypothetical protein DFH07DRAFT_951234 [Mycena maculata]
MWGWEEEEQWKPRAVEEKLGDGGQEIQNSHQINIFISTAAEGALPSGQLALRLRTPHAAAAILLDLSQAAVTSPPIPSDKDDAGVAAEGASDPKVMQTTSARAGAVECPQCQKAEGAKEEADEDGWEKRRRQRGGQTLRRTRTQTTRSREDSSATVDASVDVARRDLADIKLKRALLPETVSQGSASVLSAQPKMWDVEWATARAMRLDLAGAVGRRWAARLEGGSRHRGHAHPETAAHPAPDPRRGFDAQTRRGSETLRGQGRRVDVVDRYVRAASRVLDPVAHRRYLHAI